MRRRKPSEMETERSENRFRRTQGEDSADQGQLQKEAKIPAEQCERRLEWNEEHHWQQVDRWPGNRGGGGVWTGPTS